VAVAHRRGTPGRCLGGPYRPDRADPSARAAGLRAKALRVTPARHRIRSIRFDSTSRRDHEGGTLHHQPIGLAPGAPPEAAGQDEEKYNSDSRIIQRVLKTWTVKLREAVRPID